MLFDLLLARRAVTGRPFAVFHFHHASGEHAEKAAEFVRALCGRHGVPLEIGRLAPGRGPGGEGPEARFRAARYAWFAERLDPEGVLLTAHHADDRLETLLLALLRAAGPEGLAAMGPAGAARPFGRGYLLRPLLEWTRRDLVLYARERGLAWVEDPTNDDRARPRNFLRHHVLAALDERWPGASRLVARSLDELGEREEGLERASAAALSGVLRGHVLVLPRLRPYSPAERRAILRLWLVRHGGARLPRARFALLEAAAAGTGPAAFEIRGGKSVRYNLFAEELYAVPELPPPPPGDWEGRADARGVVRLPPGYGTIVLWADGGGRETVVRFRRGGEFLPWGKEGTRLQEFLRRRRVPPWLRGRLPLLFVGERIRAVAPRWTEERERTPGGAFLWAPESPALLQALLDVATDPLRPRDARFREETAGARRDEEPASDAPPP